MGSPKFFSDRRQLLCFLKKYWGFLFLGFVLATLTENSSAATAQEMSIAERVIFHAANRERSLQNLPPLQWDNSLAAAARRHAQLMANFQNMAHQLLGEEKLADRATRAGAHFSMIAENIAKSANAEDAQQSWMESAGHRANILNPQLTAIGVGLATAGNDVFAVEDFSLAVPRLDLDEQEATVVKLLTENGIPGGRPSASARNICQDKGAADLPRSRFEATMETADLTKLPDELVKVINSGQYRRAAVGACGPRTPSAFSRFRIVILLF